MEPARPSASKLTAFLFTDIEGSSLRWLNHRAAMERAVAAHDAISRRTVSAHGGKVFKAVGDSFYAAFDRPADAVHAAVALQAALAGEDWSAVGGLKVRMAIHVGSAEKRGGDYFGPALNRTARLLELGHGGQILLTASTAELLAAERDVSTTFVPVGSEPLDDPIRAVSICQVVSPGLPQTFPALRSTKVAVTGDRTKQSRPAWVISIVLGSVAVMAGLMMLQKRSAAPMSAPAAVVVVPTPAAALAPENSVAVLSFANLSDDKTNEYFSDGISEELLNVLAKVPGLKVSARTSAFHFKGKDTPIPEIARQLGVAYVVEGSVRKSGNRVRITAQLINAATGFHVWSDNFDREVKDIFVVQDEIAALIAQNLKLKLAVSSPPSTTGVNPEAYQLYLEGRQEWTKRTTEGMKRAAKLFQQALDLDPNFARAYVGLADTDSIRLREYDSDPEARRKLLQLVDRALQLDPNLAEAHASRGNVLNALGQIPEARTAFERALALNPNNATAHQWYGRLLWSQGDVSRAEAELRRAEELDPIAPIMPGNYGLYLNNMRRYREALAAADRALALQPGFSQGRLVRATALLGLKRFPEAAAEFRDIIASPDTGGAYRRPAFLAAQLALAGDPGPARDLLEKFKATSTQEPVQTASLLMALGRPDEALAELAKTREKQRDAYFYFLPVWDPVRDDPRFLAAIERDGLIDVYRSVWRQIEEAQAREAAK